ncbi:MAG: prolyl oligopeptidase family serine peptidase, partial [Myxococcota bacterium]|nr:prolyl oligopeptidase family serine peptidase [Myxococcota bacterium]
MTRRVDGSEPARVLLDGDAMSADGTVAIDWFYPSRSGRLLAYGISESGSEASVLHVMEVDTATVLPTRIPGTRFASVAWWTDDKGFDYTRYPLEGSRYWPSVEEGATNYHRHIYRHRLGSDPMNDARLYGEGIPKDDWPNVATPPNGAYLVVTKHRGWSDSTVYVRGADAKLDAPWTVVADRPGSRETPLVTDDALFLFTNHEAPRGRVLKLLWTELDIAKAVEIIPTDPTRVMEGVQVISGHLVVHWLHQASSQLEVYDLAGRFIRSLPLPSLGSVGGMGGEPDTGDIFYGFSSFVTPPVVYHAPPSGPADAASQIFEQIKGATRADDFAVTLHGTTSGDGTALTLFVVHRRDLKPKGDAPTVLYGYGGFNHALTPSYARNIQPFLAAGGVYAVAHLRGGGEYGEAWHRAGMLEQKENVFDDFEAIADYLVEAGFTRPERLAVMGGSNGGLLTGAATVRFPHKFRAAIIRVPL